MILKTLKTAAAIGLIFSATVVNASLIVDGGFEFGQAVGTQSSSSSYGAWSTTSHSALFGMPYAGLPTIEGLNAMHIGSNYKLGHVSQDFATSIGTLYELTYSVIGWGGGVGSVSAYLSNSSGNDLVVNLETTSPWEWVTNSFSFTASDTSTTLRLQNIAGASTIDDVSIIATTVPEPSILALIGLGIAGLGLFRRKIKS